MKRRARDGAAIVASLVVACAAVASCNFVVGVGDYSVGEADGTGGPGDETGPSIDTGIDTGIDRGAGIDATTPPGDARADVADARADAGPLRVDAGEGGPVGPVDAGVDAMPDAGAVVCGHGIPTGATFTSLVSSCVLATGCDPFAFPISVSNCITNDSFHALAGLSCLTSITSCTGATNSYYTCQGTRIAQECGATSTSSCVNNVAFDCSGVNVLPGVATDCNLTGGTCTTYFDDQGNSRADCAVVPTCTGTDAGNQCSGNDLYTCTPRGVGAPGVGLGISCTAIDATCTTATSGGTLCYFNGITTCNNLGTAACSGTTLQVCTPYGQQYDYDCSRAGGTCASDALGNVGCVSPGCTPTTPCVESCDGNHTITACVGGVPYPIDCTKYDTFTSCGPTTGGGNVYCF
jgi:predicted small secreted protein